MVFTATLFTYIFFPISVLTWLVGKCVDYKINETRIADILLVIISVVFFGWSNFEIIYWLLAFIGAVYVFGLLIEQTKLNQNSRVAKISVIAGIVILAGLLGYYKYRAFTLEIFNQIFQANAVAKSVATPLGISFITFTAISYVADIYLGKASAGNLLDCALYISFFPKLVSGPIVLWRDFYPQIRTRSLESGRMYDGICKISYGFAKKLILADTFGSVIAMIDSSYAAKGIDSPTAWLAVILYWLQIYYDFSGYSDIAIGISKIFGFDFPLNFNFPYISTSIAEFWRRWHISLGTWFKEYIYFPLGGSRRNKTRTVLNLAIVFLLTGIWHGGGYNYLLWGAINGFFAILDHLLKNNKRWDKIPRVVRWGGTTLISIAFWELFRFSTVIEAYSWLCVMVGRNTFTGYTFSWQYFYTNSIITFMIIGIVGATVFGLKPAQKFIEKKKSKNWFIFVKGLVCIALFLLSIFFMINSTYSPFIYFQY